MFAMLMQIALTFGHSHWFAQATPLAQSQLTDSAKGTAKTIASPDSAAVQKQSPANPDRERPGEDNCAICALVAMASTVVLATPPLLHLPQAVELLYRTTDAEFIHLESAKHAFQPRAPPAS